MAKAAAPYTNEYGDRINLIYIMHHVLPDIYLYISSNPNAMQLVDLFGILDFTQRLDFGTLWTHSVFVASKGHIIRHLSNNTGEVEQY